MQINWRLKSFLFSVYDVLPSSVLYFTQHNITRRSREHVSDLELHRANWEFHKDNIERFKSKNLIEFGAGKNLVQNIVLSETGIRQTVVDLNPMISYPLVNTAIRALGSRNFIKRSSTINSHGELEEVYGIRYIAPFDMRNTGFDDSSFDLCISTNTLEHIPKMELRKILEELHRIIRDDGAISAVIDYSDHYSHTDRNISQLNYLRFSESEWRRYNHSNHFQNRLRHEHYKELFTNAKFRIEVSEAFNICENRPDGINRDTLTGDDTDFARTGRWVLRV